jgi:hypothetical protein
MPKTENIAGKVEAIVAQIKSILAGHSPQMQGEVLANLLALWIVVWPKDDRVDVMANILNMVFKLVPLEERGDPGRLS